MHEIDVHPGGLILPAGYTIHQWPPPIHPDRKALLEIAAVFSRAGSCEENGRVVEFIDMEPGLSKTIEKKLRDIADRIPHKWTD